MGLNMNIYGVKYERLWGKKNLKVNVYGEMVRMHVAFGRVRRKSRIVADYRILVYRRFSSRNEDGLDQVSLSFKDFQD